jgi:hypothetical protein
MLHYLFHIDVVKVDRGMLHMFQRHVASVCFWCFRYFRGMFRLYFADVCCKCVLSGCCICFTHRLHVFYLNVTYGCNGFQVFSGVFFKCFNCLQMYVATVIF